MNIDLIPFQESMISPEYIGWLNDKSLMRFSRHRETNFTHEDCVTYVRSFEETDNFFWGIVDSGAQKLVGTITAYLNADDRSADIGILIGAPEVRGKGVGALAWGLAMQKIFLNTDAELITGGTHRENCAMLDIFEHYTMKALPPAADTSVESADENTLCFVISKSDFLGHFSSVLRKTPL